jgi:hypothetical protein
VKLCKNKRFPLSQEISPFKCLCCDVLSDDGGGGGGVPGSKLRFDANLFNFFNVLIEILVKESDGR